MLTTLLDALKFTGIADREIVEENIYSYPLVTGNDNLHTEIPIAVETTDEDHIMGLYHTANPDIDPFVNINEGNISYNSTYEFRRFELASLGIEVNTDIKIFERNPLAGVKLHKAQAAASVAAAMSAMERQLIYGGQITDGNPSLKGFIGLGKYIAKKSTKDTQSMTIDAGGTGNALTSVYLLYLNRLNGISWIYGQSGSMEVSEPTELKISDPNDSTRTLHIQNSSLRFYPGFAFHNRYAAFRIANIDVSTAFTDEPDRTAITDEKLAWAVAKMENCVPNAIVMTKQAGILLAASRTISTLIGAGSGGANVVVQSGFQTLPKEHAGIPIVYSNSIVNNEAQVTGITN